MKTAATIGITFIICLSLVLLCAEQDIAGNGTQTGNPVIVGMLYLPDGKTPACGATVSLRPKGSLAIGLVKRMADTVTVVSDADGTFRIDTIDTGTYVLESSDGNGNMALNDQVIVGNTDTTLVLPPDTLEPAGAIRGRIILSEGGDPGKVYVLVFGINRFSTVNEDGGFTIGLLAEGIYDLRVIAGLANYGMRDTMGVGVGSGDTTTLAPIAPPFIGNPTVKNLRLDYDTLRQIVSLSWSPLDTSRVIGVNIYRKEVERDSVFLKINQMVVTDSFYLDSTSMQYRTYVYRIAVINKDSTEGIRSAELPVRMSSILTIDTTFDQCIYGREEKRKILNTMTANDSGMFYVIDSSRNFIRILDTDFNERGLVGDSLLQTIGSVTITSGGNRVYISELDETTGYMQSIFMYDRNGRIERIIPIDNIHFSGNPELRIRASAVFTVDERERIFLTSSQQDSIYVCDTSGLILNEIGGFPASTEYGEKCFISSITASRSSDLFIYVYPISIMTFNPEGILQHTLAIEDLKIRYIDMISSTVSTMSVHAVLGLFIDPQAKRIYLTANTGDLCIFTMNGELIVKHSLIGYTPSEIFVSGGSIYVNSPQTCNVIKLSGILP